MLAEDWAFFPYTKMKRWMNVDGKEEHMKAKEKKWRKIFKIGTDGRYRNVRILKIGDGTL